MSTSTLNIIYIIIYQALLTATLSWYQWKRRTVDAGSLAIFMYVVYGFFAILNVNDPVFSDQYKPMTLFPFIYLFIALLITHAPIIYHHLHPTTDIAPPHTRVLKFTGYIIIASSLLLLPSIILNFKSGVLMLFTDADAGLAAYSEGLSEAGDSGSAINNLPAIIYNAMTDLSFFLFFYFLTRKDSNKWFVLALALSMTVGILMPIMKGLRGGVINSVLTMIMAYMLFRPYLSKIINRIVKIVGISSIAVISLPIIAISVSRFGGSNAGVNSFMYWYVGQGPLYFNSYGLDDNGIRYGDRTFNMFKRVIDSKTSKNFVERRERFHQLYINDDKFTTFIGDFTIDFGPVAALIIFIVFNSWVLVYIHRRDGTIQLHQLLLIYFTLCVSIQGGMSLYNYSDTGNLRLIVIFMLYFYLYYHDKLLTTFPLINSDQDDNNK